MTRLAWECGTEGRRRRSNPAGQSFRSDTPRSRRRLTGCSTIEPGPIPPCRLETGSPTAQFAATRCRSPPRCTSPTMTAIAHTRLRVTGHAQLQHASNQRYVPGLPVFAAANTRPKVEQAIRETLAAYLEAHPESVPTSAVRVARVSDGQRSNVHIVGVAALLGTGRSRRKARAFQMNGRLGGRPRRNA